MIEFGSVVAVLAASFGLGVFWYEFLRRPQKDRYRLTAISFVGVLIGPSVASPTPLKPSSVSILTITQLRQAPPTRNVLTLVTFTGVAPFRSALPNFY